jgi:hypothetical protein
MNNIFFCKIEKENGILFVEYMIAHFGIELFLYFARKRNTKWMNIFFIKKKMIKCKKSFSNGISRESRENDFR